MISQHGNTSLSATHRAAIVKSQKTAAFTGFFDCFPVIKTHIVQYVFYTVKKNSLWLLASLLKVYFIAKAVFSSVYWGKRKQFSPFSLLQGSSLKTLHREQAQLAPTPLNSRPQEATWEKRQRTDMENKVRKKKESWEEKHRFRKDLARCTAFQGHQPSGKQVQEGTTLLLGALLGMGWIREGQKQKVFPTVPPVHHLPSIPTNCSLNKQLFGKFK